MAEVNDVHLIRLRPQAQKHMERPRAVVEGDHVALCLCCRRLDLGSGGVELQGSKPSIQVVLITDECDDVIRKCNVRDLCWGVGAADGDLNACSWKSSSRWQ